MGDHLVHLFKLWLDMLPRKHSAEQCLPCFIWRIVYHNFTLQGTSSYTTIGSCKDQPISDVANAEILGRIM